MKQVTIFDHIEQREVVVDAYVKTGLRPGDVVFHKNEGKHGGNGSTIRVGSGIVEDVEYQGEYHWGGQCWVARVNWSNGETFDLVTTLLYQNSKI